MGDSKSYVCVLKRVGDSKSYVCVLKSGDSKSSCVCVEESPTVRAIVCVEHTHKSYVLCVEHTHSYVLFDCPPLRALTVCLEEWGTQELLLCVEEWGTVRAMCVC